MATILIVDDRPLTRKFLVLLLGYAHYHLLEAEDGAEALKIIKKESVDLIITDILMPTMDGYELVKALQKIPTLKNIPVIFYTATYRAEEARALAESCGVHFVLSKPTDPQLILDTVQNALGVAKPAEPPPIPLLKEISTIIGEKKCLKLNKTNELLSRNLSEIESIKQNFHQFLEQFEGLVEDKDLLLHKVNELSKNLKQIETLSSQLVTIIELNTDLIAETNPKTLLRLFCMGTRRTLKAKCSVLGILNAKGTELKYFLISGMSGEEKSKLGFPKNFDRGFIHNILEKQEAVTINNISYISKSELLPYHPPIKNFIGVPIVTKNHLYGFFYFADKLDGTTFSEGDQQLARSLVSELSVLYENFELYDALQRHATKLQLSVTQQKK